MELQLTTDTIAIKELDFNPFKKKVTESGILLIDGIAQSEETGQVEMLNQIIGFGIVTLVGPDCKRVKVGDGVYYDRRVPMPIPFNETVWIFNEGNVRAFVRDENLTDLIKNKAEEIKAEEFKNSLKQPIGLTLVK